MEKDSRDTRIVIWIHRILRWSLGITFLTVGITNKEDGRWFAIVFGVALIITGFFRPRRCLGDSCNN